MEATIIMDNTEQETVYTLLTLLIPAINNIDGKCFVCIRQFVQDANEGLEKLKILFRYEYHEYPDKDEVEVIKV